MKFTGERLVLGRAPRVVEEEHLARYRFIDKFVKDKTILDVACGTGYGTNMISGFGAREVHGVDISSEAIAYAKDNYSNASYWRESATKMHFDDNYFDVVVSFETIEHLPNELRGDYLLEIKRVLRPNGLFIVSTPNRIVTSPNSKKPLNRFHVVEYSLAEIKDLLAKSELPIKSVYGQRFVSNFLNSYLIRKFFYFIGLFNKIHLKIYDEANGPEVMALKDGHHLY